MTPCLCVEVIREVGDELRLDRRGVREQRQVVRQLLVLRHDDALATGIEPRSARTAEDLLHVQHAQVPEPAARAWQRWLATSSNAF